MKSMIILLTAAVGLIVHTGCKSHEGAYAPVLKESHETENREPLVLMDPGAQRSISTTGIQRRTMEDGRLQVTANIVNRENRRLQVQVNCVFKDAQGFSTGDESPWRTLILTENSQESVSFTSLNDKAEKFTIRVREAR